ncbi:transposase [Brucella cytisi]|uniref:transposase n=1 Tax=Brucella cytisi TaxID=407152 RepID=UPI00313EF7A3
MIQGCLKGLLPIETVSRGRGRRPEQRRAIINGILRRLRCCTSCSKPWRDVPPKHSNGNTIYQRFRRWSEAGVRKALSFTIAGIMAGIVMSPSSCLPPP